MTELWRPFPDWEGFYEVSAWGRARSLDRVVPAKLGSTRTVRGRILDGEISHGYARVDLRAPGRRRHVRVHQAVLRAFVGPCPPDMEACHGDGDPTNNEWTNLRWDTKGANQLDSIAHGTHHNAAKEACPRAHLLALPNLRAGQLRQGFRACLACSRARAWVAYHPDLDLDVEAARYYVEIMGAAA